MTTFTIHTSDTAPEASKPLLAAVHSKYGFVPNLLAEFAEAPNVLKAYMDLSAATASGTLSPIEQQIVQISASRLNGCHYCIGAHSTIADKQNLPAGVIESVRNGTAIVDTKLEALHQFARAMVRQQGRVSDNDVNAVLAAGYTKAQVLEVVISVALKTISNYANHIMHTPVDQAFQARAIDPALLRGAA